MIAEFKKFIMRGSVLDLAIGVIIGAAFGKIVDSLVNDIIMPPIGLLLGGINFSDMFLTLKGGDFDTLAAAKEAGAVTLNYGNFINVIIMFLIVALVIFLLVRWFNKMTVKPAPAAAPTTTDCPFCFTAIPIKATRCPHCTSEIKR
jgi:large conductance mechanosensitive channel